MEVLSWLHPDQMCDPGKVSHHSGLGICHPSSGCGPRVSQASQMLARESRVNEGGGGKALGKLKSTHPDDEFQVTSESKGD